MSIAKLIENWINSLPEGKQVDIMRLHQHVLRLSPESKLWFLDGKDASGKVVSNPNIGYGVYTIRYANGTTREFYRVGISANTTGISVYVMGIEDKKFLVETYGSRLGKASVTGYCIKFKKLGDINMDVLDEVIKHRLEL